VTPIAKVKVDLTESAEFRSWQAARDRREAQLQGQVTAGQQQMQEMQQRLAELQLANADPEEVVAFYQQQLANVQAERAQVQQAQTLRQEVEDAAGRLLGASWEGYAKLAESVAKIEALKASEAVKMTSAEVSQAAQAAKTQALEQAGVTKVSTATGAAVPKDLKAEYDAAKAALVGTGDVGALTRLKTEYRKKGLEV
jgi:chromosome segregation ATPase